jgi:hypothetical protein
VLQIAGLRLSELLGYAAGSQMISAHGIRNFVQDVVWRSMTQGAVLKPSDKHAADGRVETATNS